MTWRTPILVFIRSNAHGDGGRLMLATLLKTRQDLGCFAMPEEAHRGTVAHLAAQLGLAVPPVWPDEPRRKSLYRYQAAVRAHLSVGPYDETAERWWSTRRREAAETMSNPADLINRAVEALQAAATDLPAFSTPGHFSAPCLSDGRPTAKLHRASLMTRCVKDENAKTTFFKDFASPSI